MDSASNILNSFNDLEQLKSFCESQYKTIVELSYEIDDLKKKNEEIKAKSLISLQSIGKNELIKLEEDDQEIICRTQIALLRSKAMNSELTLEEARKLELYSKILGSIKPKEQDTSKDIKELNDNDLILLVSNGKKD